MNLYKTICSFILLLLLNACMHVCQNQTAFRHRLTYGNEQNRIILQNLNNRIIATCHRTAFVSAEACAKQFERNGYTRLSEIPYKTANYDFIKTDTYPTRRWRGQEITPRW